MVVFGFAYVCEVIFLQKKQLKHFRDKGLLK